MQCFCSIDAKGVTKRILGSSAQRYSVDQRLKRSWNGIDCIRDTSGAGDLTVKLSQERPIMLYNLLTPLTEDLGLLNLFRYITFRTAGAIITSLIISFVFGKPLIKWLKKDRLEVSQSRSDGPESHIIKQGTPTMGGLLILISMSVATLLWADLSNRYIWAVLLLTLGFGAIGFADDYLKLARSSSEGLPGKIKLLGRW